MDREQQRERQQYGNEPYDDEASTRQRDDRAMTQPGQNRSMADRPRSIATGESSGQWQGFVVPYRYYGPGYAGLGYYAVYYQGEGRQENDESSGFDQRNVQYGQGQGAGAAWQGGRWQDRPSGGHAGRGPRGYKRSDERIREEISDRLTEHDAIDASDIEVTVKDGVATLTGSVDSRWSKRLAEELAERAPGVRDVMNQIRFDDQARSREMGRGAPTSERDLERGTSGVTPPASGSRSRTGTGTSKAKAPTRTTSQPVGSAVGGATDGETGNGSTRDSSN